MIFQHTWPKVLSGEKTATSRIVKPSHEDFPLMYPVGQMNSIGGANMEPGEGIYAVMDHKTNRTIYQVGEDYAVQPGRGIKSAGRILVTELDKWDVRTCTGVRANQEGYQNVFAFLSIWTSMHDKTFYARWAGELQYSSNRRPMMLDVLNGRDAAKYTAWFIRFELLEVYK